MTERRIVNLEFNAVDHSQAMNHTGFVEFYTAVGYLANWNFTFPRVDIYIADRKDGELRAVYFNDEGKCGYVIGAIFREGKYEFHS